MKNIYHKITISPLFYLVGVICAITGNFKLFMTILLIIIVHEIGHILTSLYFHWDIDKIVILPFGGLIKFNNYLNSSLLEEFIICIMGPIFQLVFWIIVKNNITIKNFDLYNKLLLTFNLLPIYTLDGAKILNIILNRFISFKKSYIFTIIISLITAFVLIYLSVQMRTYLIIILVIFLIIKALDALSKINTVMYKFIMEKYLVNFNFKRIKIINNLNLYNMYKNCTNIFICNHKMFTEKMLIKKWLK
jgi:stage IV sporulation protein FB